MVQWVSVQSNYLIISIYLHLQLIMCKPVIVKRKIKISVQMWVWSVMSLEGG